jgi:hypothetical protein
MVVTVSMDGSTLVRRAFDYEKAWCEFQCGKVVD